MFNPLSMLEYLAIPYTHKEQKVMDERFALVNAVAAYLTREGRIVYSPISHSHPWVEYGVPREHEFWKNHNLQFLSICKNLIIVTAKGWRQSLGVQFEIATAKNLKISIEYFNPYDESKNLGKVACYRPDQLVGRMSSELSSNKKAPIRG